MKLTKKLQCVQDVISEKKESVQEEVTKIYYMESQLGHKINLSASITSTIVSDKLN